MTLRRSKGRKFKLCCDEPGCKSVFGEPFFASEIKAAAGSARMHGWDVIKTKAGNWRHYCPKHDDGRGGGKRRPAPLGGAPQQPREEPVPIDPARMFWIDD